MSGSEVGSVFDQDQISAEHRSIRSRLSELEALVRESTQSGGEIFQMVESILEVVTHHFRQEEASDLYSETPQRVPSLAPRLAELKMEHAALMGHLMQLRAVSEQAAAAQEQLASIAGDFIASLREHEQAEAEVIQQAFLAER